MLWSWWSYILFLAHCVQLPPPPRMQGSLCTMWIRVRLFCFPFSLAFMRRLLIGFHSNSDLSAPFFRIIATPSRCNSSSRPEYNTVSPDTAFNLPVPIHLLSLTPNTCRLYRLISVVICASFPVSYMVRTFQNPILVLVFALIASNFMPVVSLLLSPLVVIQFEDLGRSACRILVVFVAFSVTNSFYRIRLLALSLTPMPEGPWDCLWSGPYSLTFPAWEALPGV